MSLHQDGLLSIILMLLTSGTLGLVCSLLGLSIIFNILAGVLVAICWNPIWNKTMEWMGMNSND